MTTVIADENADDPTYSFKPSLLGAPCRFTLRPDALHWEVGRRSGRTRYDRIAALRLSYRPVTMQSYRFIAEIWSPDNPKIQIASVSWRSMVQQERLDAAYRAFIADLHGRLAAAGSRASFSTGLPFLIYWVGVVVFSVVIVTTAIMVLRTAGTGQWGATAIIAIFFLMFAYQLGQYFYRNRPGRYSPEALPQAVLPPA